LDEKTVVSVFWTILYILTAVTLLMRSSFEWQLSRWRR